MNTLTIILLIGYILSCIVPYYTIKNSEEEPDFLDFILTFLPILNTLFTTMYILFVLPIINVQKFLNWVFRYKDKKL